MLGKQVWRVWIGSIWLRTWTISGSCKQDSELSGFMKGGKRLDYLSVLVAF
jgi:hypothetical protein